MEGASGVTRWQDVITAGQDYQRARSWMTADVNAAVTGARRAGATEFVVEENHGVEMLCNLVLDELDPDVDVVRGLPRGGPITAENGVPTALVTGDDVIAAEMAKITPGIEAAIVKRAMSRTGGWIVPPK